MRRRCQLFVACVQDLTLPYYIIYYIIVGQTLLVSVVRVVHINMFFTLETLHCCTSIYSLLLFHIVCPMDCCFPTVPLYARVCEGVRATCIYMYNKLFHFSSFSFSHAKTYCTMRHLLYFWCVLAPCRIQIIWYLILTRKRLPPNVSMNWAFWTS